MSQQIDNQIVKMQFDNSNFEKNVQTSMSTIDKLKKALKFNDVGDSLDPLQQQLNSMNMDKISNACDAVTNKFSFFGTVVDQVVRDMTTKVANAAEKMVKSFTIDQVASGWEKYAQKTTAVQTIMANTIGEVGEGLKWADQAEQMAAVTEEIEKLNWFTDETSYSLTDMTDNIGKFVAQKVPLEQATRAMMGISTWAAVSGQTKTQAGMAMYNLSQSLGAGAVKAIDWKSIENANMATAEFKETVIETAKALGVLDKETGIINEDFITAAKYNGPDVVTVENFRDTLSAGWFNSNVLMDSLEKYGGFSEKMNELYNVVNREGMTSTTSNLIKILDNVKKGSADADQQIQKLAKSSKMSYEDLRDLFNELATDEYDLGRRAFAAAQEAKTFQEAIDATSDAVASEWMGIFEAIFGNYLEAKELWTDLSNTLWDIFAGPLDNIKWSLIEWKDTEIEVFDETEGKYKKLSGRELLLNAVSTAFNNIAEAIEIVRSALADVFPIFNLFITDGEDAFDTSEGAEAVVKFTKALKDFADSLKLSEDAAESLHTIVHLLATGMKIAFDVIGGFFEGVFKLVGPIFNIVDAIFGLIGKIISALTGNEKITDFADDLNKGAGKVKNTYLRIMDRVAEVLNKIADAIRGLPESQFFSKIHDGVIEAAQALQDFWNAFVDLPIVQQMIDDFNKSVESIQKKVTPIVEKAGKAFEDFKKKAKGAFSWETVNDILTKVYSKVQSFINLVKGFAARVKTFFSNIKEGKSIVESFKESFGDIVDKIKELKDNIFNFFQDLFNKGDELGGKFDLASIQQAIHDFVSNITPDQITMIAVAGSFMLIALNLLRLSEAMKNAVDAFTGIGTALKNVINSYIKKQKSTILQVAEAIVIVAASLWVLSTIPEDRLQAAIGAMMTLTGLIGVLTVTLTMCGIAMHKFGGERSMVELASGLVFVSGAFMVAVLAMKALEYVNLEGILPKVLALGGIMVALVGLSALMSKIDKFSKGSITMVAVAGALYIAAQAMAKIGEIPVESLDKSIEAIFKIMLGIAAITFAAGHVGALSAIGLIAVVLTINKLLPSIENLVNYDYAKIEQGLDNNKSVLLKLGGVLTIMAGIGVLAGNRIKGVGIGLLGIAAAFAVLAGIAKLAGSMKPSELAQGEEFMFKMGVIISMIELFSARSRLGMFGGKNGGEGTKALTRIAVTMGLLLGIAKLASLMKPADLIKGELAVLGLTGIVLAMSQIAKRAQNTQGVIKSVAAVMFAVSLILGEIAILSMIPLGNMAPALIAVLAIITSLALLTRAMNNLLTLSDGQKVSIPGIIAFVSALAAIVGVGYLINVLAKQPIKNVSGATASLVAVIAAISIFARAIGKISGKFNTKQLSSVIGALVMVAAAAGVLYGLSYFMKKYDIDPNTMIKSAIAISTVLLAISPVLLVLNRFKGYGGKYEKMKAAVIGAIGILASVGAAIGLLSNFGGDGNKMIQSAIALAIGLIAICAPIAVLGTIGNFVGSVNITSMATVVGGAIIALAGVATAIWVLSNFGNPDTMIKSAQALAIGLVAISIPIAVLGAVGRLCSNVGPGGIAGMAVAVAGSIVALGAIANTLVWFSQNINSSSLQLLNDSIPILITAMAGVGLMALAIAAAGAISGGNFAGILAGGLAMVEAVVVLGLIVTAIAGIGMALNVLTDLREGLITGLDFLVIIAGKIGEAIGALISGFTVGITKDLGTTADNLKDFSEKMIPFSENMEKVSSKAVEGCKNIAAALLYMTAADFLDGIGRLFGLGTVNVDSFDSLGKAMAAFSEAVKDVPEDAIKKASTCSVIAKRLAEVASNLNVEGGIVGKIFGETQSLDDFAKGVASFGTAILRFCTAISGLPEDAVALAQRAVDTAEPMITLSKALVAEGGIIQKIIGEKNIGSFGQSLLPFVTGLSGFVKALIAIEEIAPDYGEMIQTCSDAMQPMVSLANSIENSGGILARLLGDNTLDVFGDTLIPFANSLRIFVNRLKSMVSEVPNYKKLISDVVDASQDLVTLANSLENMGGAASWFAGDNTLDKFGQSLKDFGYYLNLFVQEIQEVDFSIVSDAVLAMTDLVALGSLASQIPQDAFLGLEEALDVISKMPIDSLTTELITGTPLLVEEVTNMFNAILLVLTNRLASDKLEYEKYGKEIILSIRMGVLRNTSFITAALGTMILTIKNYMNNNMGQSSFEVYGKYIALGVKKGIDDYKDQAVAAARDMVEKINAEIRKVEEIKSPSKVTYGFGRYIALGLANGIRDYASVAVESTTQMSENIITQANDIISSIARVIESDMDTQPTIRPVLDTSDIESKAGSINRLFSGSDLALAYKASSSINEISAAKTNSLYGSQSGDNQLAPGTQQINFTQNNYSPKALSRYEIYRDTKNTISMMKGVIANA